MSGESIGEQLKFAFRIDEAVKATGLGRSFLYERMASGELKSVKICGRRLILREDLMAFLHQKVAGALVAPPVRRPVTRKTRPVKTKSKSQSPAQTDQMELPLK